MNTGKSSIEEPGDMRYEAYLSLLDHRIRRAWVRTSLLQSSLEPLGSHPASGGELSGIIYDSQRPVQSSGTIVLKLPQATAPLICFRLC